MSNFSQAKINNPDLIRKIEAIPGWLSLKEAHWLYVLAKKVPDGATLVEIGSYCGRSTVFLGLAIKKKPAAMVYAVDHHLGSAEKEEEYGKIDTFNRFKANIKRFALEEKVVSLREKSLEAGQTFNRKIDLLFIDGGHDLGVVEADWKVWTGQLKKGGWVLLHDATVLAGPWQVAKKNILFSSRFERTGMVGSMVYGRLAKRQDSLSRLRNRVSNFGHYLFIISYVKMRKISWLRNLKRFLLLKFTHATK